MRAFILLTVVALFSSLTSEAGPSKLASRRLTSFESWLAFQRTQSEVRLLGNLSPSDALPGTVIASPERHSPNYYFHWIRDAALTMDVVVDLHDRATGIERANLMSTLVDYARLSRRNQMTITRSGMGEPKFNVDGTAFDGDWCRPQNDGPALRAVTLIRVADRLLANGEAKLVKKEFYDGKIPTHSVIKADLEFVAHNWRVANCDIWEEVFGDHLYTRLAQRRALVDGAELAMKLGDAEAARFYRHQAKAIDAAIDTHWDSNRKILVTTLNRVGGLAGKTSDLDSQVVLGVLHGSGIYVDDSRVRSTVAAQTKAFEKLYSINSRAGVPGVAIGRYPEDVYDGDRFEGGNPWVLTTAAFATVHYMWAATELRKGDVLAARLEFKAGDSFLERLRYHSNPDGSFSEQMQRDSGYQTSARELTWSYAEFLRAVWARDEIKDRF